MKRHIRAVPVPSKGMIKYYYTAWGNVLSYIGYSKTMPDGSFFKSKTLTKFLDRVSI